MRRSQRRGIAAGPYSAPAIMPAIAPVVSASPPWFTVVTSVSSSDEAAKRWWKTVWSVSTTYPLASPR